MQQYLKHRQKLNPAYSLRSMALQIGVSAPTLSRILNGKRGLSIKMAYKIIDNLKFTETQKKLFLNSVKKLKYPDIDSVVISKDFNSLFVVTSDQYEILSDWEYFALYDLIELDDFKSDLNYISKKMDISIERAHLILEKMISIGLINKDKDGNISQVVGQINTTEDINSLALQASHAQTLDIGKQKLTEVDVLMRDFSSIMIPSDPDKLPEVKKLIREFRHKVASILRDGHKTELYQLAIQLFPMTNLNKGDQ